MDLLFQKVLRICERFSNRTYENLTKIIRYDEAKSADSARDLDDSFLNDVDYWMGGGTCFSMTWFVYLELLNLKLEPKLMMGHKRKEKNIHCALRLPYAGKEFLFDPGYLIFTPLEIPKFSFANPEANAAFFPLKPNVARLVNRNEILELWTGSLKGPLKLRFEFDVKGVSEKEFKRFWSESFHKEMMTYPVLNRLDAENGVQYYFQKGNLMIRTSEKSEMIRVPKENQIEKLSEIFNLSPELIEKALTILDKKK